LEASRAADARLEEKNRTLGKQLGASEEENRNLREQLGAAEGTLTQQWPENLHRDAPRALLDREFLLEVFLKGMPPALIKEWKDRRTGDNLLGSEALLAFEQELRQPHPTGTGHGISQRSRQGLAV
jgi:hypothetical protein